MLQNSKFGTDICLMLKKIVRSTKNFSAEHKHVVSNKADREIRLLVTVHTAGHTETKMLEEMSPKRKTCEPGGLVPCGHPGTSLNIKYILFEDDLVCKYSVRMKKEENFSTKTFQRGHFMIYLPLLQCVVHQSREMKSHHTGDHWCNPVDH